MLGNPADAFNVALFVGFSSFYAAFWWRCRQRGVDASVFRGAFLAFVVGTGALAAAGVFNVELSFSFGLAVLQGAYAWLFSYFERNAKVNPRGPLAHALAASLAASTTLWSLSYYFALAWSDEYLTVLGWIRWHVRLHRRRPPHGHAGSGSGSGLGFVVALHGLETNPRWSLEEGPLGEFFHRRRPLGRESGLAGLASRGHPGLVELRWLGG
ncbi:MAG: hypothetical protein Kow0069_12590 [Promethearchaeota archaeon]